jgi:streptogramin lyase
MRAGHGRRRLTVENLEPRSLLTSVSVFPTPGYPGAITTGSDGNLWFTLRQEIGMINPTTDVQSQFTLPGNFYSNEITTGPDGNIWFTGTMTSGGMTSGAIGTINVTTHAITEFPDQMPDTDPAGITTGPDGNRWFTSTGTNDIGIFDPTTGVFTQLPVPSPDTSSSDTTGGAASGITTGPDRNIWVSQDAYNAIVRINPTTHAITEFPISTTPGELLIPAAGVGPGSIAAGPDGNIWFTESSVLQIGVINLATDVITQIPTSGIVQGGGITAGPDGNVWFTEIGPSAIAMIDPTTDDITTFPLSYAGASPVALPLTLGPDGNLWFAAPLNSVIGVFDPGNAGGAGTDSGGAATNAGRSGTMPVSSGKFGFMLSVDSASSGADANSTITLALAAGPGGDTLTVSTAQGIITDPGLTLKKEGRVYKLVSATAGTRANARAGGAKIALRRPILTERVLTKGKGKDKHAIGVEVSFRKALDPLLATDIAGRSKTRSAESAAQPVGVRVIYGSSLGGASLDLSGKATSTPDGRIIVVAKPYAG